MMNIQSSKFLKLPKQKWYKKPWIIVLEVILAIIVVIAGIQSFAGPQPKQIEYGVTFSVPYAQGLGINWQDAYTAMLTQLNIKLVRVPVYWDEVENKQDQYDFSDIDFMVQQAASNHAQIIMAIGKKLPRWPECHVPAWAGKLSSADSNNALLSYMEAVIKRYQNNNAIITWQVENEPFLQFGTCAADNGTNLQNEISFVKQLDPTRPVLVTDSGELNWWLKAGSYGDEFGSTYYRYIYSDVLHRYWTNFYFPDWFYRFKAGLVKIAYHNKPVMLAELEAEPWTTAGIPNTSINEQMETMSLDHFHTITHLAAGTGFSPQILWGVEWWYWMRQHGHPEFWRAAQQLINHQPYSTMSSK